MKGSVYNALSHNQETPAGYCGWKRSYQSVAFREERLVEKNKNDFGQPSGNKINGFADLSNNVEMKESNSLQEVVTKGKTEILKILLERRVDVLQVFEGGNTALHVAAAQGQSATVDILIRHCQDRHRRILQNVVNVANDEGSTPLHVAVDVKTVKCLLKHGALYDAKNKANRTPLDLCQVEEIRSLLETVEDLFSCVQNGKCDDVVGKIEALDSDVAVAATRARNSSGKTLLLVALQTNKKSR
ncbi:ANK_REP_REGION domain-containing protein [Caerostris extrusa]|uniref:ANK_REP_REGION domain-containing protein n=1 Tax=Caerostris extrusa TaxID=172846 RepID=A0AAV4WP40_CAEEX|nr:ANK_REP_REGION domain-containing protein [Caerostris extrusa]